MGLTVGLERGFEFALLAQCETQQSVGFEVAAVFAQNLTAQTGEEEPVRGNKRGMQAGCVLFGVFGVHDGADLRAGGIESSVPCAKGPTGPLALRSFTARLWVRPTI